MQKYKLAEGLIMMLETEEEVVACRFCQDVIRREGLLMRL